VSTRTALANVPDALRDRVRGRVIGPDDTDDDRTRPNQNVPPAAV
jgi:hypothetical protein